MAQSNEIFGLVPAAGAATRLGKLPCSKELLPVGVHTSDPLAPRVACEHLLQSYRTAGIRRVLVMLREGKWDLPRYLCRRPELDLDLAYLFLVASRSVPETLDEAYPFVRQGRVALGFPDVLFYPRYSFQKLVERQEESGADIVLGLFPCSSPWMTDMVQLDGDNRVIDIEVRNPDSQLKFNWLLALWGPRFTELLHTAVAAQQDASTPTAKEFQLGTVLLEACRMGLHVEGVSFPEGSFLDMGTAEGYAQALRGWLSEAEKKASLSLNPVL